MKSSNDIRILFSAAAAVIFQVAIGHSSPPPSIVRHPLPPLRIFRPDEQIDLECEATGQGVIRYRWLKDGVAINERSRPNVQFLAENRIRILSASVLDEGLYNCQASNDLGTAVSNEARLLKAVLGPFLRPGRDERLYSVDLYSPLRLECNAPVTLPSATFSWVLAGGAIDDRPIRLRESKRIQIDPVTGDLCFSYSSDSDADGVYKCEVFNPFLDLRASGSYSRVNVTQRVIPVGTNSPILPSSSPISPSSPPSILFSTDDVVALEQSTAILRCFFAGYPELTIDWQRLDGTPLPIGRYEIASFGSALNINDARPSDESDYVCIGRNDAGEEERILHLSIEAAPRFISPHHQLDRPYDINATDGDSVTFNCRPYADPKADVTWYQNAIPINLSAERDDNNPIQLSADDGSSIVIRRLCKNCSDDDKVFGGAAVSSSPSSVIQCKASNVHGTIYANGYINVLDRTRIVVAPTDQSFELWANVTFGCRAAASDGATSDPLISYNWYHNGSLLSSANDPSIAFYDSGQTLHITTTDDADGGMSRVGSYVCRVSNGYSAAEASANLVLFLVEVDQTTTSLTVVWLLTLLLLLLLFLLLLCCIGCCCYKFRPSEKYNVDEKEKKNGLDPEAELADLGFKVYIRTEGLLSKSLVSLDVNSQSTTLSKSYGTTDGKSEEGGSWNFDRWFNEDGSFIGAYKEKR